MRLVLAFLAFCNALFAAGPEYDYIVVGTSPFSLFEALYKFHSGHRVLIIDEAESCGGAWRAIDVCGVPHADLGCHQIGHNLDLKAFFEEYAGCKMVSLDDPLQPFEKANSPHGFYFSQGCFELADHLRRLIQAAEIPMLLGNRVRSVSVDVDRKIATVHTDRGDFTASKLIVTPATGFDWEKEPSSRQRNKTKYYHLYLLVSDPTPPQFTYKERGIEPGVVRVMNLTHFAGLAGKGRQILIFQTNQLPSEEKERDLFESLKKKGWIDPAAFILQSEQYVYEVDRLDQAAIRTRGLGEFFEILQTGHIEQLAHSISKWKRVLKPFETAIRNGF